MSVQSALPSRFYLCSSFDCCLFLPSGLQRQDLLEFYYKEVQQGLDFYYLRLNPCIVSLAQDFDLLFKVSCSIFSPCFI